MKTKLFLHAFILLCIVWILNEVATKLYLYWTTSWFDVMEHTLAGITVGMTMVLLWQYRKTVLSSWKNAAKIGIVGALVIGILWEVYELAFGITTFADGVHFVSDTISDLICDAVGGFIGSLYAYRLTKK